MIVLNYQITEHYKSEDEECIKLLVQNIIKKLVISDKNFLWNIEKNDKTIYTKRVYLF